jgi:O-antigen/teichoic acid export membrane protein
VEYKGFWPLYSCYGGRFYWQSRLAVTVTKQLRHYLRNQTGVLHNALWLLGDKVTKALCLLVISALLARHFGPDIYGKLAYALAFVTIFQGIANLGLDPITVREVSTNRKRAPDILGTVFGLRLLAGLILWPLSTFLALMFSGAGEGDLLIVALVGGILLFQATDTIDLWFQSQGYNRKSVIAKLSVYIIGSAARLYLLYLNCPLWVFAAMATVDTIILSTALSLMYKSFPVEGKWVFKRDQAIAFLREGWPFMLSGVAILVYARIDQLIIKNMLDDYNLGIYSVAVLISGFFAVIPVSVCSAAAPYVANLKKDSHERYMRAINLLSLSLFLIAILISAVIFLAAGPIIHLLYGQQYDAASNVLRIHIFSIIPMFLGVAQATWIVNEKKGKIILYKTLVGLFVSITLNTALIPTYGISVAAFVAIITQLFASVLSNAVWDKEFFKLQVEILFNPVRVYFSHR